MNKKKDENKEEKKLIYFMGVKVEDILCKILSLIMLIIVIFNIFFGIIL